MFLHLRTFIENESQCQRKVVLLLTVNTVNNNNMLEIKPPTISVKLTLLVSKYEPFEFLQEKLLSLRSVVFRCIESYKNAIKRYWRVMIRPSDRRWLRGAETFVLKAGTCFVNTGLHTKHSHPLRHLFNTARSLCFRGESWDNHYYLGIDKKYSGHYSNKQTLVDTH